jgi:hypothetical protein
MTQNFVVSNVVMKIAYISFGALGLLFVSMLVLTVLHP